MVFMASSIFAFPKNLDVEVDLAKITKNGETVSS